MRWQPMFLSKCLFGTALLLAAVGLSGNFPKAAAQNRVEISGSDPRILVRDWINDRNGSQRSTSFKGLEPSAKSSLLNNKLKSALISIGNPARFEIQGKSISKDKIITYVYVWHENGTSVWCIEFDREKNKISHISYKVIKGEVSVDLHVHLTSGILNDADDADDGKQIIEPYDVCASFKEICKAHPISKENTVEFLFATTRTIGTDGVSYTGQRSDLSFGVAKVSIPDNHKFGQVELPEATSFFGYSIYEEKLDPAKHFVIKQVAVVAAENWRSLISSSGKDEALIFVHGFNTSFQDASYREAQIVCDIGYTGLPVLFSWASSGRIADYFYDQQSALIARKSFLDVLDILHEQGIKKINIIAHSMGNFIVLDALQSLSILPQKQISELILAAPDVDIDY